MTQTVVAERPSVLVTLGEREWFAVPGLEIPEIQFRVGLCVREGNLRAMAQWTSDNPPLECVLDRFFFGFSDHGNACVLTMAAQAVKAYREGRLSE